MACRILTGVASTFESISYDPISRFDRNNETSASTMKQSNERILREYYWCIIPGVSMDGSSEAQALISHPQRYNLESRKTYENKLYARLNKAR
ncbi:hypothetical protein HZH68_006774 [Vespula germanica]|uniref:Uncharacterized protein n=1 Tax=Vespula germanica TaxID=30212 RepID=A0A834NBK3_VESGE|nr:hypothetical protein HZH68_006774 [Vespula germanica]